MTRCRRRLPALRRSSLRTVVGPVLLAGLVALTSCGTVPPPSGGDTPTPAASTGSPHIATRSPSGTKPQSRTATPAPKTAWVGRFQGQEIRIPRGHGATISFTFDDGPRPASTPQVLDLLEQHHVPAAFCLIGRQAQAYPSLVQREVAAGHVLCDHSRDHDIFMNRKGQAYVDAEVGDGLAAITRAAPPGTPVTFYRQPGGTWSPKVVRAMDAHGLDPLRWSDDPKDWSRPGSTAIVQRVVSHLQPGAVVLMHDGGGDRSQTVEALRFLLDAVVAAGWKPVLPSHVKLTPREAAQPG